MLSLLKNSGIIGKLLLDDTTLDQTAFWAKHAEDFHVGGGAPVLGPITCAQILTDARKLWKKAIGPDGLSGAMLALPPQAALIRAAQMLNLLSAADRGLVLCWNGELVSYQSRNLAMWRDWMKCGPSA